MTQHSTDNAPSDDVTHIAVAVVEHQGRFLVGVRPSSTVLAGKHEFPGGKVKSGESPEAAAIRECHEETGLGVEIVGKYSVHVESYAHDRVALHFFAATLPSATSSAPVSPPWQWVPRCELSQLDFPKGNRELIRDLLASQSSTPS